MSETLTAPPPAATAPAPALNDVVIRVKDLDFYYGKFQGLRKVNLDIARKKVTAFIGPSGCGKSTLLRTLNRMFDLYPGQRAEGQIIFNGKNILDKDQDVNLLRAKVGMVFQKPTPFPMTIYENIAFGVRLYESLSSTDMNDRVEWALRKAALWEEVKDKLQQSGLSLSGGQQQRLCIARMVAVKPDVLLLDEPTSDRDRHPQHAAGGAHLRLHRLHVHRRAGGVRRDQQALHQADQKGDRGLHHRPLRLKGSSCLQSTPTRPSTSTSTPCAAR